MARGTLEIVLLTARPRRRRPLAAGQRPTALESRAAHLPAPSGGRPAIEGVQTERLREGMGECGDSGSI